MSTAACRVPGTYLAGFCATAGRTPGYLAASLQMVRTGGTKPGLGTLLSWSALCLGYLWMLWDGGQQSLHDTIAGTRAISMR